MPKGKKTLANLGAQHLDERDQQQLSNCLTVLADPGEDQIDAENVPIFFRAMGWIWSDAQIAAALRRRLPLEGKFSFMELMRCADVHAKERFGVPTVSDQAKAEVKNILDVFDFNQPPNGRIMRADSQKYLGELGCEISE